MLFSIQSFHGRNRASIHLKIVLLITISLTLMSCDNDRDNFSDEFQLRSLTTVPAVSLNGSGEGYTAWAEGGGAVYARRMLPDGTLESPIEVSPALFGASVFCLQTTQPQIVSSNQTTIVSWVSFDPDDDYTSGRTPRNTTTDAVLMASVISNGVASTPVELVREPSDYACFPPLNNAGDRLRAFSLRTLYKIAVNDDNSAMLAWRSGFDDSYYTRFFNGTDWGGQQLLDIAGAVSRFALQAGSSDFLLGTAEYIEEFQLHLNARIYDSTGVLKSLEEFTDPRQNELWFMNKANDAFLSWPAHINNNITLNVQKYSSNSDSWGAANIVDLYSSSFIVDADDDVKNRVVQASTISMAFDDRGNGVFLWGKYQGEISLGSIRDSIDSYHLVQCFSDGSCNPSYEFSTDVYKRMHPAINISPDGQAASILYVSNTTSQVRQTDALLRTLKLFRSSDSSFDFTEELLANAHVSVAADTFFINSLNYHDNSIYLSGNHQLPASIPFNTYLDVGFFSYGNNSHEVGLNELMALDNSHTTLLSWVAPAYHTHAVNLEQISFKESLISLNVSKNGQGFISSALPGIDCGSDCSEFFSTTSQLVLTALADAGHQFTRWSGTGDCAINSSDPSLTISLVQNSNCVANFEPVASGLDVTLTLIILGGPGAGEVNSSETPMPTMQCLNSDETTTTCTASYATGSLVSLVPSAFFPNNAVSWINCGAIGEFNECGTILTQDTTITATFSQQTVGTVYSISAGIVGNGSGSVISRTPASITGSINCPANCSDLFIVNASGSITLEAVPDSGSLFIRWGTNQCDSESVVDGVGICTINLINGLPTTTTHRAEATFF